MGVGSYPDRDSRDGALIVVTGATGFLGSHVTGALQRAGYQVRPLGREAQSMDVLTRAFRGAFGVVHVAGVVGYRKHDRATMIEANVELTKRVLTAAKQSGIAKIVHVSSIVTIGYRIAPADLMTETNKYNAAPLRLAYWDTKHEAEELALTAAASAPPDVVCVNPGTLLGPGERRKGMTDTIRTLSRLPLALMPRGGSDFADVRDVAEGIVLALKKGKNAERYILGSENLSYRELYLRIRKVGNKVAHALILPSASLAILQAGARVIEEATGCDLGSAWLRRTNGLYLYHSSAKAIHELGYAPHLIDEALADALRDR